MIKKTSVGDYNLLLKLEKECFPLESWNLEQITNHHNNQSSLLCIQEEISTEPVGYLFYLENSFELEILRIGVSPSFRGFGIAKALLDFLDALANGREILLEVKSGNFSAIELYKKKGFINFAVRKRYYSDGNDAILMKKESKNDR